MVIALSVLHYLICIILIVVILLQAGRGHGLAGGMFGGDNTQSLFGTKTTAFMTKVTSAAAILFLVTCLGLDMLSTTRSRSLMTNTGKLSIPGLPADIDANSPEAAKALAEALKKAGVSTSTATTAVPAAPSTDAVPAPAPTLPATAAAPAESVPAPAAAPAAQQ